MHKENSKSSDQQQPRRRQAVTGRDRRDWRMPRVAPSEAGCACEAPRISCATDGTGAVVQCCLRCGESNTVARRPGMAIATKRRVVELTMFRPAEAP